MDGTAIAQLWMFWAAPIIGAVVGAILYKLTLAGGGAVVGAILYKLTLAGGRFDAEVVEAAKAADSTQ